MLKKIEQTREFKKDLKRLAHSGRYQLDDLETVLGYLIAGQELPKKYRDHSCWQLEWLQGMPHQTRLAFNL